MIKRFSTAAICLAASGSMALAQQPAANPTAATTGAVKGTVLVNHGTGFVRVPADAPLAPGDRLMARPGGSTTIVYADKCIVKVKPGATVTVKDTSPCKNAPTETAGNAPAGEGAPGGAFAAGVGVAAAGIITGIVLATTQNRGPNLVNGSPISP